ncbi:hypothetical protein OU426_02780 [Frigidibacter sp. RF13]|uniref:hypothetical protein n=1 Tax=Frigidibacter sp. RF13 TaxID=2997340 RepID=UPI0022713FA4|nr:hypothetical protein [Frigidibacter sp. RF13]MCY1125767.1 hypothetical protein [Frigidibacter sp. RF13]
MSARAAASATLFALAPGVALAHASQRAVLMTLPTKQFVWGAGAVVALTALLAGLSGRVPAFAARRLFTRPRLLPDGVTSWLSAALLFLLIVAGLFGTRDPYANPLSLWVWTVLWVGVTLVQALFGNLWRHLDPWTGPVRSLRALLGRKGSIGLGRLGQWPAVAGLLAFAWFEIVSLSPDDPAELAVIVAAYWLAIFLLAVAEGEDWLAEGEFLTVFFTNIARIAPFWAEGGDRRVAVMVGPPGAQVMALPPLSVSAMAFLMLMIASVSFDGLHETFLWVAAIGFNPLDYPGRSAAMGVNTLGLLATWGLMAGLVVGVIRLVLRSAGPGARSADLVGPLALSFLPIAAGYHVAHYLTALLTQGQYAIAALSDPLARGDDLLGLGPHWVGFGFLTDRGAVWAIWAAQFAIILGAHLVAVLLGQRIVAAAGLRLTPWQELPLTLLMVLYTCFGLWLLAAPAIG